MRTTADLIKSAAVEETTTTAGTGAYLLNGPTAGYFAVRDAYSDGDSVTYRVWDGPNVEVVTGVFDSSANTLSRDIVLVSSAHDTLVNWSTNTRRIIRPLRRPMHGVVVDVAVAVEVAATLPFNPCDAASHLESSVSHAIPSRSFTITTISPNDVIVLHIAINNESGNLPSITGVSTLGLVWNRRATKSGTCHGLYIGGPDSVISETWYAIAAIAGTYTITINTNSDLGFLNATAVAIKGADTSSPWDNDPSLPGVASNFATPIMTTIKVDNISTQNAKTMILFMLVDFDLDGLPVEVGWNSSGYNLCQSSQNVNAFIGLLIETGTSVKLFSTQLVNQTIAGRIAEPPAFTADHYQSGAWVIIVDALKML